MLEDTDISVNVLCIVAKTTTVFTKHLLINSSSLKDFLLYLQNVIYVVYTSLILLFFLTLKWFPVVHSVHTRVR